MIIDLYFSFIFVTYNPFLCAPTFPFCFQGFMNLKYRLGFKIFDLLFVWYRGLEVEKSDVPQNETAAKRNEKLAIFVTNSSGMVKVVFVVCKII